VTVLPTLESKLNGAETTVLTVETDELATFLVVFDTDLVVFDTDLVTDLTGLSITLAHKAGRTSAKKIDITTTAAKTRNIFTTMIFILF
jgi:hypothetical protein